MRYALRSLVSQRALYVSQRTTLRELVCNARRIQCESKLWVCRFVPRPLWCWPLKRENIRKIHHQALSTCQRKYSPSHLRIALGNFQLLFKISKVLPSVKERRQISSLFGPPETQDFNPLPDSLAQAQALPSQGWKGWQLSVKCVQPATNLYAMPCSVQIPSCPWFEINMYGPESEKSLI